MPRATIDWKSLESYQRLLAAMCAANDNNVDYKKIAYYFGQGATYDSIEGRFRIAKKFANQLKEEAEADPERLMPSATRPKSANSTPRKPKAKPMTVDGVQSGRVQKSPSKKRGGAAATAKVKQEPQTPTSMEESADTGASSPDHVNPFDEQLNGIDADYRLWSMPSDEA